MLKLLKWGLLAVVVLVGVGVFAFFRTINSAVRKTVETQSAAALAVPASLDGASVSVLGGRVALDDYKLGSPDGFDAPTMFSMGTATVDVSYGDLFDKPVRVRRIDIDSPTLVVEQKGGRVNVKVLSDGISSEGETLKLIIGRLTVTNARVLIRPGLPGVAEEVKVVVPKVELNDIGTADGANNGQEIGQVVVELLAALAKEAAESGGLPAEVEKLMAIDPDAIVEEGRRRAEGVIGEVGKDLPPEVRGKANDAVEKGLEGLLNRKKRDANPATE